MHSIPHPYRCDSSDSFPIVKTSIIDFDLVLKDK